MHVPCLEVEVDAVNLHIFVPLSFVALRLRNALPVLSLPGEKRTAVLAESAILTDAFLAFIAAKPIHCNVHKGGLASGVPSRNTENGI
ncbi:hypothetical protein QLX08_007546 [Tetragonisca angustula]|uniref:Uncharacterized protein n=1 Tax=Tetragonisca angustula TaxID=166442 RepID=A0AAW0ZQE8_9HYME